MHSPPPPALKVRSARDGCLVAVYGPILVVHVAHMLTAPTITALRTAHAESLARGSDRGVLFVFARKDLAGGMNPGAREIVEQLARDTSLGSGLGAVVMLADGFVGAAARSVVAGLLQLDGDRRRIRVFDSTAEACRVLGEAHGFDGARLERAYDDLVHANAAMLA